MVKRKFKKRIKIGNRYYFYSGTAIRKRDADLNCKSERRKGNLCRIRKVNGKYRIYTAKRKKR